ncbi:MAG: DMT family transporter, partial [Lysinibacillus sp.]
IGACIEVLWVIGLKHATTPLEWIVTVICILLSFYFIIAAGNYLPVGSVYAVFVGLGTAGTVVVDLVVFNEPVEWSKLFFIAMLLAGVIGLKIVTDEESDA